jgi:hypothetical protein
MTVPALVFGIFISTFYGVVFHLWKDGGLGRLILYVVLSWIGFMVGHLAGGRLGWTFVDVGPLHLGWATLGSLVFLGVGHWLSLIQVERQP